MPFRRSRKLSRLNNMRVSKRLEHFFSDMREMFQMPRFIWSAILAFLFCVLDIILPILRIAPLHIARPFIPLHYNIYFGVDKFGSWIQIFSVPLLGFCLLLLNLIVQTIIFRREKFLAFMIAVATVLIECILLCAMVLIVLLNLSYAQ